MGVQLSAAELRALIDSSIAKAVEPYVKNQQSLQAMLFQSGGHVATIGGNKLEKNRFGMFLRCMAGGRGRLADAKAFAEQMASDAKTPSSLKAEFDWAAKSLSSNVFGSGGAFVPEDLLPQVIEFLRPMSAVRRLDPTILPNPNGNLHVPKLTSGANAQYRGEATDNKAQQQQTGDVVLTFKILDVIIPITKELIMTASPNVDAVITQDATRAIAQAEDTAFIRGAGSAFSPKGIRFLIPSGNIQASAATGPNDFANIKLDVSGLEGFVAAANVPLMTGAFMMPSTTFINLRDLRNANGFLFYPSLSEGKIIADTRDGLPHLNGYPVAVSNNIPHNLTVPGPINNTGELYFGASSEIIIGEMTTLEVEMSTEASYRDANGVMQSAFTRGELLLKLTARHDIALRHDFSWAVATGTQY